MNRRTLLTIPLLLTLACKGADPYLVASASLDNLGDAFLIAVDAWKAARDSGHVSELQYQKWKEFGTRFQQLYPVAIEVWHTATQVKNQKATAQMEAVLTTLSQELQVFITEVTNAKKE
jgi:hypothetical protein